VGGLLQVENVRRDSFLPALKRARIPRLGLKDLRHTSATLLLAAGVNVKVVSERLGHEDIKTTLRHYAHVLPSMQGDAADAMDRLLGGEPWADSQ
jgi:integrase